MSWPRPRVRLATVEADVPGGRRSVEFGRADEWRVLVMHDGRPLQRVDLPDPGRTTGDGIVDAAVLAACDDERRRLVLGEELRGRLGVPQRRYPRRSTSVIVCTRGRPESLSALLEALRGLDPAPEEVVVVDNAPPPGGDCRELAKAAGAVYVREDTPGLNMARRAGVAAARGELLAFTDDDCLPPIRWLAALPELFDDRSVGAVTGPTLPAALDTPSRVRFEEVATFSRGFRQLRFDCMSLSPPEAVRVGAGANMVFRRSHLDELGQVFPPELDAGTPTRSGGDHYAFYKVLAAGRRIVYDPRVFTYHMHRADPGSLHETVYGYGVGLSAVATKVMLEDGELAALKIWRWMGREYVRSVLLALAGRLDPVSVRMRWDYVRGALAGPGGLRESRRRSGRSPDGRTGPRAPTTAERPMSPPPEGSQPEVSVVVTTHRAQEVTGCLEALGTQEGSTPFEVVLVHDSADGAARRPTPPRGLPLTALATKGVGRATARNAGARAARGDVLLFLDDDLVPARDLVARHAARHRTAEPRRVVVGYSPPRPTRRTLAAISASLWWEDHFREKAGAAGSTFVDVLAANMSVRRETFERVGPFDPRFGRFRREHWEWGMRALRSGVEIAYEADAVALHRFSLDTRARLAAARSEGHGDALLVERYPEVLPSLPVASDQPAENLARRLLLALLRCDRIPEGAVPLLNLLELLKARKAWATWFRLAVQAAYEQGFRDGGGRRHAEPDSAPVARLELASRDALPQPKGAAPALAVTLRGEGVTDELPQDGRWSGALAERIAAHVPTPQLRRIAGPRRATGDSSLADVTVLLPGAGERPVPTAREHGEAELLLLPSHEGGRWEAIDDAIRSAGRPLVAVPLAGATPGPGWPAEAVVAFEGERVTAVLGRGLAPQDGDRPLTLHAGQSHRAPYSAVGVLPEYVVVRRAAYIALGGFDPRLACFGEEAPVLDLVERTLAAGWIVGQRDTAALYPPPRYWGDGWRTDWVLARTRGALIARGARERGPLWFVRWGGASVAANLWRAGRPTRPARRNALVSAAAVAFGAAQWAGVALLRGGGRG